jgi:hypothetical protein
MRYRGEIAAKANPRRQAGMRRWPAELVAPGAPKAGPLILIQGRERREGKQSGLTRILVLRFSHLIQLICLRITGPAVFSRSKVEHLTDSEH